MNIYIHTAIIVFLLSAMDVFQFRLRYKWKYAFRKSGWDGWHVTKWILITYIIGFYFYYVELSVTYKEAGLMFMWLTIITVGLHHIILHKLFKEN